MAEKERKEARAETGEEKALTIKISLEGPAALMSWARENRPDRVAAKLCGLLPGDFRKHVRAARREQLLAVRSLLDAAIARMEREDTPPRRATKVEIE